MEHTLQRKVVAIMGACNGIGEAPALLLAQSVAKIVLRARGEDDENESGLHAVRIVLRARGEDKLNALAERITQCRRHCRFPIYPRESPPKLSDVTKRAELALVGQQRLERTGSTPD